jgi:hypothetical protein
MSLAKRNENIAASVPVKAIAGLACNLADKIRTGFGRGSARGQQCGRNRNRQDSPRTDAGNFPNHAQYLVLTEPDKL